MNEHVSRLEKIGIGPEGNAGTQGTVSSWIPKSKGIIFTKTKYDFDQSSVGTIDKNRAGRITEKWSEFNLTEAEPKDQWIGHILKAAYGLAYPCIKFPLSGVTGTPQVGETITETTSTATGTLRRADAAAWYIDPTAGTGTFTGGKTLTGGTSGATATGGTIESPSAVRHHLFQRANNNNHQSYSIFGQDPVSSDEVAVYCMLDTLDIESSVGKLMTLAAKFMGRPMATTTTQTPSYTAENPLLSRDMSLAMAGAFSGLDAASVTSIERFKSQITKGAKMVYAADGSLPPSPTSIHNTEFDHKFDFTGLFNATTLRDLSLAGTPQAMRLILKNSGVTIGSAAHPSLQIDWAEAYLNTWSKDDNNAEIVRQTVACTAAYNQTNGFISQAILVNTKVVGY